PSSRSSRKVNTCPPVRSAASTTVTSCPRRTSSHAQLNPAMPAPAMMIFLTRAWRRAPCGRSTAAASFSASRRVMAVCVGASVVDTPSSLSRCAAIATSSAPPSYSRLMPCGAAFAAIYCLLCGNISSDTLRLSFSFREASMKDFAVRLTHRPGELARVANMLSRYGVNLKSVAALAIDGQASVHILPDDAEPARAALEKNGIPFEESEVVTVLLENRAGELASLSGKLSEA